MADPIEFYFDFSSPYGYLAAHAIDETAARHGRDVTWRPMLLGAVFKITGQQPLVNIPIKGDYTRLDLSRTARLMGLPFTLPEQFPFMSVSACRAFYWLDERDPKQARVLARKLYQRAFGDGAPIAQAPDVVAVAAEMGLPADEVAAALKDQHVKDLLRGAVDAAIERSVFGSPYIIVDGEPFWGVDHLPQLERWLETGGW